MTGVLILKGQRRSLVFRYFNLVGELCEHSYGERETDDKSNNRLGVKHCKITASTKSNQGQFGN